LGLVWNEIYTNDNGTAVMSIWFLLVQTDLIPTAISHEDILNKFNVDKNLESEEEKF